jgi:hypothetical protein
MGKYASEIIKLAQSWIGRNEKDGTHKMIIDVYNAHRPLARWYKVKYTDNWCATTISAMSIKLGMTDIIPTECSCQQMIELFKKIGCWVEDESVTPKAGWIIFYDWQDNGKNDAKGWADHTGIIEKVDGNTITVIEGNYNNAVKRRAISVNAQYIRGYGVPKYDAEPKKEEVKYKMQNLKRGSKGTDVEIFEAIMKKMGYYKGDIDGSFGKQCVEACNEFQKDYPECGTNGKPDSSWGKKCWKKMFSLMGA